MRITQDVHDIVDRLREVDGSYHVEYNTETGKFELFGGKEGGYILTFPYERLDERAVRHARRTRVERLEKMMEEMEAENRALEAAARRAALAKTESAMYASAEKVFYDAQKRNR